MSTVFNKELGSNTSTAINNIDDEVNEDQVEDKENREKVKKIFVFFLFINIFIYRLMKQLNPQQQQHRKVGIINRIRKKRQKRKGKHQHRNQIIIQQINNQQHRLLIKINLK